MDDAVGYAAKKGEGRGQVRARAIYEGGEDTVGGVGCARGKCRGKC